MKQIKVNDKFRHKIHFMPKQGWMNDPNGFSYYKENYHLFYQYYPNDTIWGPMHWGHATTKDFIMWNHEEIALKPDKDYDKNGVFSGGGIQVGDEHWLYYTGHNDKSMDYKYDQDFNVIKGFENLDSLESGVKQVQCLAISKDGQEYKKYKYNPIISEHMIPLGIKKSDFRDPKVWIHKGVFYMLIGAKSEKNIGSIQIYKSYDGIEWNYFNNLSLGEEYGTVWECPDLFELDGKHVLLISPQEMNRIGDKFENLHSTLALIGLFDYSTGEFKIEKKQEIDLGFDFYAPQTVLTLEGKRVMIAWMSMWSRDYLLHEENHGWNGSMTLPRELSIKDNKLIQVPVSTLDNYSKKTVIVENEIIEGEFTNHLLDGTVQKIEVTFNMKDSQRLEIELFKSLDESFKVVFDKLIDKVYIDRKKSKYQININHECADFTRSTYLDLTSDVQCTIILDVSSIEIFINGGTHVFTSLFYSKSQGNKVSLTSHGSTKIKFLNKYSIR